MRVLLTLCCFAAMASSAVSQTAGVLVGVAGIVSPNSPSVTIDVGAGFNNFAWFAFGAADIELTMQEPGGLGAVTDLLAPEPPNTIPGWPQVGAWSLTATGLEASAGQLSYGPNLNVSPLIKLFSVDWSTTDFTPRTLLITVKATQFGMYVYNGPTVQTPTLVPDVAMVSTIITVIPAPASAVILAAAGILATRRRR